jgi:hypothetical protein
LIGDVNRTDLLGLSLDEPLTYAGHSLFAPVPEDRLSIAISANVWRRHAIVNIAARLDEAAFQHGCPSDCGE